MGMGFEAPSSTVSLSHRVCLSAQAWEMSSLIPDIWSPPVHKLVWVNGVCVAFKLGGGSKRLGLHNFPHGSHGDSHKWTQNAFNWRCAAAMAWLASKCLLSCYCSTICKWTHKTLANRSSEPNQPLQNIWWFMSRSWTAWLPGLQFALQRTSLAHHTIWFMPISTAVVVRVSVMHSM